MDAVTVRVLWGVTSISLSLVVLAAGVLYAWMGSPARAVPPAPPTPLEAEQGYSYTCYCYRDPVQVTVPTHQRPRLHGRGHRSPGTRAQVGRASRLRDVKRPKNLGK